MHPDQVDQLLASMRESAARFARHDVIGDLDKALREVVAAAVAAIPDVTHAGITTLDADGRLSSTAPSANVVARLDQAQAALCEGPCVAALTGDRATGDRATGDRGATIAPEVAPISTRRPAASRGDDHPGRTDDAFGAMVRVDDMANESHEGGRWPRFGPEALRNGVISMLSLPLSADRYPIRALNLYAQRRAVFDTATCATAALFAEQATVVLSGAERLAQLDRAVATRDIIGQAKGILIERHHLTNGEEAFAMLVEASQHANLKLRDVAEWLVADTATNTPESRGHRD